MNDDATLMAVSNGPDVSTHKVTVYRLPGGEELASFGGKGSGKGQFCLPCGLCFTVDGTLLVADCGNKRILGTSLLGEYQRSVGEDVLKGNPIGVTANETVIVASQCIAVFDYRSGSFIRGFGERGSASGQLDPRGLRITPDGCHIFVAENTNKRLSLFAITGEFIRVIGATEAGAALFDVCFDNDCDIVTAGYGKHEIIVFSPDDSRVLRRFGCKGTADGQFMFPTAVAFAQGRLYVLNRLDTRVQVFE